LKCDPGCSLRGRRIDGRKLAARFNSRHWCLSFEYLFCACRCLSLTCTSFCGVLALGGCRRQPPPHSVPLEPWACAIASEVLPMSSVVITRLFTAIIFRLGEVEHVWPRPSGPGAEGKARGHWFRAGTQTKSPAHHPPTRRHSVACLSGPTLSRLPP
jgi:hypothetical protein